MARYHQLDSLRGLAALAVVVNHTLNVLPVFGGGALGSGWLYGLASSGPLHLFWAGHQAVVFFFVLSGFVLSLPFYKEQPGVAAFVIKRICRICIPYWAAVLMAFMAFVWFSRGAIPELSVWLAGTWSKPITAKVVAQHLFLVGNFENGHYNPALWSLVVEMRISLLFPLLMLCVTRLRWQVSLLAVGMGCYALGRAGDWYSNHISAAPFDYGSTLMYGYMFIAGALLAKHASAIGKRWRALSPARRRAVFALAVITYAYVFWLPARMQTTASRIFGDFPTVAAICIFVVAALNSNRLSARLLNPSLVLLGKVSYSLYLLHGIVVLALVNAFYGRWPLGLILVAVVPVSLVAAIVSYHLIEVPAIGLGRRLAVALGPRTVRPVE